MNAAKSSTKLRTKTGCRTCRIRRVKCDEDSPVCRRCTSTGRKCEWFEKFTPYNPSTSKSQRGNSPAPPKLLSALVELPNVKTRELRGFEFFQVRTAQEMCQAFEFGFWQTLVLQLSRSEPAILHAAIALGTLHEAEETRGMTISKDRLTDERHQFAVAQYNTAIRILTEQAYAPSSATVDSRTPILILATCLIFIHIDLFRGHYESAVVHIKSALGILDETSGTIPPTSEAMMRTAFLRLDLQSAHFDQQAPYFRLPEDSLEAILTPSFERRCDNVAASKDQYDLLSYHTFQLLRVCEKNVLADQWDHLEDTSLLTQQQTLSSLHSAFLKQCAALDSDQTTPFNHQDRQAIKLLQMHAGFTKVLLTVCLSRDVEGAFDPFVDELAQIVALAREYVDGFSDQTGTPSKLPSLSTDWGIIFPLTFIVLKCRKSAIRREALTLLETWPHREGFWDSSLAVAYTQQIMDLEEKNLQQDSSGQSRRTTSVLVDVTDDQQDMVVSWEWNRTESGARSARNTLSTAI